VTCSPRLLPALLSGALLATVLPSAGCASTKLLRLENEVLKNQNQELQGQVEACLENTPPPDFATDVSMAVVAQYMARVGYQGVSQSAGSVLSAPITGRNTDFQVNVQLFTDEKVLFLAVSDYLRLEDATTSSAMVLLLTQLAAMNYELLLGKFQLNPSTGEISLSVELNLDDGLGFRTFKAVSDHLIRTADQRYPELLRAAQGTGL
jgi:hypothetical protein